LQEVQKEQVEGAACSQGSLFARATEAVIPSSAPPATPSRKAAPSSLSLPNSNESVASSSSSSSGSSNGKGTEACAEVIMNSSSSSSITSGINQSDSSSSSSSSKHGSNSHIGSSSLTSTGQRISDNSTSSSRGMSSGRLQRLIYLSCGFAALMRDTDVLLSGEWKLTSATAYFFFPATDSIETLAVFDRA
jgi:hypothetical protein